MLKKTIGKTFLLGIIFLSITETNLGLIFIMYFGEIISYGSPHNEFYPSWFNPILLRPYLWISLPFTAVVGLVFLLIGLRRMRAARAYNAQFDLKAKYTAFCPRCGNRVTCTIRGFRADKEHPDGFRRCSGCGAFVDRKYFGEPILKTSSKTDNPSGVESH